MHWEIEVIIRVEEVEIDYINEGLLLHHSITDIENPSSIWIKERKENGKIVEETCSTISITTVSNLKR